MSTGKNKLLKLTSRPTWFLLAAVFYLVSCQAREDTPKSQNTANTNLLFIVTDQHPLSCVGAYGNSNIKTPYLDELAQEGFLLENYYIAAFACSPSRASLLTGRYLHNHNVYTNNVMLDPTLPTLGTLLSQAGFHTGYFGKAHLAGSMYVGRTDGDGIDYMHESGPQDPVGEEIKDYWHYQRVAGDSGWIAKKVPSGLGEDFPQLGFKDWAGGWRQYKDWLISHGQQEFARMAGNHDALQSAPEGQHMYSKLGEKYHMAAFFREQTQRFINEHQQNNQPWAAVISFFGPHLPVAPPKPWDTLYSLSEVPLPINLRDSLKDKPRSQNKPELQYVLGQWSNDQYRDYIRRYWGYSSYIDEEIGKVLQTLKETDQWDNTIIIFTTDHGDMVGAHGMIYKLGGNGYEELFHVPAILRIPGLEASGTEIEQLVSSVDLLPTVLEALNLPTPAEIDGKSLMPVLRQSSDQHREALFSEIHGASNHGKVIICRYLQYKYVYHWLSGDVDELYDLAVDPGEMQNLYQEEEYRKVGQQMRNKIIEWTEETQHRYKDLIKQKHLRTI